MADQFIAEATPVESQEIPAYVVRQAGPRDYRAQAEAPRPSMAARLSQAWNQRKAVQIREIPPVDAGESAEPQTAVRYEARLARRSPVRPVHLFAGAAVAGVVAVAGLVGNGMKAERPAPVVAASSIVSASPAVVAGEAASRPEKAAQIKRTQNVTHVVAQGDSFTSLGAKYGVTPRTVRLANELPLGATLTKGQKLVVPPSDGAYHRIHRGETVGVLAKRYGVSEAAILKHNPGLKPKSIQVGHKVFIPGATALRYADNGTKAARGPRTGAYSNRLSASRSLIGQFGNRVGQLSWPAEGEFSSPFGVRGSAFHPGLDISGQVGTPIHAAKAGTVLTAGWAGAYGYAVDIDHGAGVVTRYGHCSKLLVKAGQTVEAGDEIAKMGSTGRSTGPHVHFEVRIQGRAVNPATFF